MGFIIEDKKFVKYESEPGIIFVVIPEGITEIGKDAFRDCSEIKIVVIPDTVTVIGESAFRGCSGLMKLKLPDSITVIEGCAFQNCSALTEMILPPGIKELKHDLFEECKNLKKVVIPDGVVKFWGGVFYKCSSLKEVNIPDSVKIIGGSSFSQCTSLEELYIPDSVTDIYQNAFYICVNLKKIHLPKKLKSIEREMFYCCENLRDISIPDGVESIDEKAFLRCGLEKIVFPDSVKYIGWESFYECNNLRSVSFPDNPELEVITAAFSCTSVSEIIFPKSGVRVNGGCGLIGGTQWYKNMTSDKEFIIIDNILYKASGHLINAVIPEGVKVINDFAFSLSKNIQSVIIPDSVETICDLIFGYDISLQTITFENSGISLSGDIFKYKEHMIVSIRNILYNKSYYSEVEKEDKLIKYLALTDYLSRTGENDSELCQFIKENIDEMIYMFIKSGWPHYISVLADYGYILHEKIEDYTKHSECHKNNEFDRYKNVFITLCEIYKKLTGQSYMNEGDLESEKNTDSTDNTHVESITDSTDNNSSDVKTEDEELEPYEVIQFGNYNGEPLKWRVLEKQDDKILVISEHVIAERKYHSVLDEITWDKCDLRKWLNNEFINEAFTSEEQYRIILSTLINDNNPVRNTPGGETTQDKVFCISEADSRKYFKNDKDRICTPTEIAIKNGIETKENNSCHWWLRSPGASSLQAASIFNTGMVFGFGMGVNWDVGVRPALWLDISE